MKRHRVEAGGGGGHGKVSLNPRDRLIFALDFPTTEAAEDMVAKLGPSVTFYKVGLQLFLAEGGMQFAQDLAEDGKKIFLDLKLFDVPETVANAVRQFRPWVTFATVHAYQPLVKAAFDARGTDTKLLAVTVLTSLDRSDLHAAGMSVEIEDLVLMRARAAAGAGADGVIASGREAALLRRELGGDFLIVTPGIRDEGAGGDDQKRTVTVRGAFEAGADYIVVGRPIRAADDPRAAAGRIQETIGELFA